jgi:hypothetical protein
MANIFYTYYYRISYFFYLSLIEVVGDPKHRECIDFLRDTFQQIGFVLLFILTIRMIMLTAVLQNFVLMTIPESFELPLLIIGKQFLNGLEQTLGQLARIIFTKGYDCKNIYYKLIIESFEQDG